MSDRESLDVAGHHEPSSPQSASTASPTKATLFPVIAPSGKKTYNYKQNECPSSVPIERHRLIVPTAIWVLVVVASLCFISLLSSLNKSISRLDTMVELEQKQAAALRSLDEFHTQAGRPRSDPADSTKRPKNGNNNNNNKQQQLATDLEQEALGWFRMPELFAMPSWTSLEPTNRHRPSRPLRTHQDPQMQMMEDLMRQLTGVENGPAGPDGLNEAIIIASSGGDSESEPALADMLHQITGQFMGTDLGPPSHLKHHRKPSANEQVSPITANVNKLILNLGEQPPKTPMEHHDGFHHKIHSRPSPSGEQQFMDEVMQQMMDTPLISVQSITPLTDEGSFRRHHHNHHSHNHHSHNHHNHHHRRPPTRPVDEQLIVVPLPDSFEPNGPKLFDMMSQPDRPRPAPYEMANKPAQSSQIHMEALADGLAKQLANQLGVKVPPIPIGHHQQKYQEPHMFPFDPKMALESMMSENIKPTNSNKNNQPDDLLRLLFGPPPSSSLVVAPEVTSSDRKEPPIHTVASIESSKIPKNEPHVEFVTPIETNSPSEAKVDNGRKSPADRIESVDDQKMLADMMDQILEPLISMGQFGGQQSPQQVTSGNEEQSRSGRQSSASPSTPAPTGAPRGQEQTTGGTTSAGLQQPTTTQQPPISSTPGLTVTYVTQPTFLPTTVVVKPTSDITTLAPVPIELSSSTPVATDTDITWAKVIPNQNQVFPETKSNSTPDPLETPNISITTPTPNDQTVSVGATNDISSVSLSTSEADAIEMMADHPTRSPADELGFFRFESLSPFQMPNSDLPTIIEGSRTTFSPRETSETLSNELKSNTPSTTVPSSEITPSPSTLISESLVTASSLSPQLNTFTSSEIINTKSPAPTETATNKTGGFLRSIFDRADDFVERNMIRFKKMLSS